MIMLPTLRGLTTRTSYKAAVMSEPSLVAYWRLGESSGTTSVDEKGTYPGVYAGTYALAQPGAISDGNFAVGFSGVDGKMSSAVQAAVGGGEKMTIEVWIYRPSAGSIQFMGFSNIWGKTWAIQWYNDNVLYCYGQSSVSSSCYVSQNLTGWHHVVFVFDGSLTGNARFAVYVDGSPASLLYYLTPPATVVSAADLGPLVVGRFVAIPRYSTGRFDEVAIYNTALSATRVEAHYNAR